MGALPLDLLPAGGGAQRGGEGQRRFFRESCDIQHRLRMMQGSAA